MKSKWDTSRSTLTVPLLTPTALRVKEVPVVLEGTTRISPVKKVRIVLDKYSTVFVDCMQFEDAGLHPVLLRNVKLCGYDVCTPVQAYCVPAILKGHDVFASAHTGK